MPGRTNNVTFAFATMNYGGESVLWAYLSSPKLIPVRYDKLEIAGPFSFADLEVIDMVVASHGRSAANTTGSEDAVPPRFPELVQRIGTY